MFRTAFVRPASRLMLRQSGGALNFVATTRLSRRVHSSSYYRWFFLSNASCRSSWFPLSLFIESTTATTDWRKQTDPQSRNRGNDGSRLDWKGKVHIGSSQTHEICIPGKHALVCGNLQYVFWTAICDRNGRTDVNS